MSKEKGRTAVELLWDFRIYIVRDNQNTINGVNHENRTNHPEF